MRIGEVYDRFGQQLPAITERKPVVDKRDERKAFEDQEREYIEARDAGTIERAKREIEEENLRLLDGLDQRARRITVTEPTPEGPFTKVMDSGQRERNETTGAQRDSRTGKGRFDLITPIGLKRLAQHYENGAVKYGDRNWEKGLPISRFLDSCIRHLYAHLDGDRSEDHLAAVAWNAFAAIHIEQKIADGFLPEELSDLECIEELTARLVQAKVMYRADGRVLPGALADEPESLTFPPLTDTRSDRARGPLGEDLDEPRKLAGFDVVTSEAMPDDGRVYFVSPAQMAEMYRDGMVPDAAADDMGCVGSDSVASPTPNPCDDCTVDVTINGACDGCPAQDGQKF